MKRGWLLAGIMSSILLFLLPGCGQQAGYTPRSSFPDVSSGETRSLLLTFDFSLLRDTGQPEQLEEQSEDPLGNQELHGKEPAPAVISDILPEETTKGNPHVGYEQDSCTDDCNPTGRSCDGDVLLVCENTDDDPCMDLSTIQCTFGCNQYQCRKDRQTKAQSDVLREPLPVAVDASCSGQELGVVLWNPNGGICREFGRVRKSVGHLLPLTCCNTRYLRASCILKYGTWKRGLLNSSEYTLVGCYDG